MAWIEFDSSRIKKLLKFRALKSAMSWSTNETLGFLGQLWREVLEIRPDGDLTGWSPDYLVEITDAKTSDSEALWRALTTVREGSDESPWIDNRGGRFLIHDWLDRAGPFLIRRYSGHNRSALDEIWKKHGRIYGRFGSSSNGAHQFDEKVSSQHSTVQDRTEQDKTEQNQQKSSIPADASAGTITSQGLIQLWNETAPKECPRVVSSTKSRLAKISLRIKEHPSPVFWCEVLGKINRSSFLKGGGNRSWKATFDWIIANDKNVIKIIEGAYEDAQGGARGESGKYEKHLPRMPERN